MGFHVEFQSFSFDTVVPNFLFKLDDDLLYVDMNLFLESLISMEVLMMVFVLIISPFLFAPSKLPSFLNIASLNLLSLRSLPLRILLETRLICILDLTDL